MIESITDSKEAVDLLLQLCRTGSDRDEKEKLRKEAESFTDWKLFTGLAVRHGVAALVWQNLADHLSKTVPTPEVSSRTGSTGCAQGKKRTSPTALGGLL